MHFSNNTSRTYLRKDAFGTEDPHTIRLRYLTDHLLERIKSKIVAPTNFAAPTKSDDTVDRENIAFVPISLSISRFPGKGSRLQVPVANLSNQVDNA